MAKRGNILYTNKNFTDAEVQQKFGFPCILILHDNASVIKKITAFDKIGTKTIYDFSLAATKDFVIQSIADAVTLEEWNGTEAEHAEYLKSNPKWWNDETFFESGNA